MTSSLKIDLDYLTQFLVGLLNIPSPTGYSEAAIAHVERALSAFPVTMTHTQKGALVASWPGSAADKPRGVTAHVDTLGAMVKEIKTTGRLKLTKIGGYAWQTVEGEGVSVLKADGSAVRGTILPVKASVHVHGEEVTKLERKDENIEVRLDARVKSGFIRSRHLDDKACVAIILAAVKAIHDAGLKPAQRTTIHISNYEEVGHGAASGFPPDLAELLTVDMAAVGEGQNSDEFSAGICVKDSGGPYHIEMRRKLVKLAEDAGIPYKLDIYPFYGSDGEAYWRAGGDVKVGLIGPGVDASHSYERTHKDSLEHTARLVAEYLVRL
ncbi:MAG: M42 family metallopeptidase [Chloroflexi bacterium]|nr:M42 family metallopeptidase [Chloroflexota bacterium]